VERQASTHIKRKTHQLQLNAVHRVHIGIAVRVVPDELPNCDVAYGLRLVAVPLRARVVGNTVETGEVRQRQMAILCPPNFWSAVKARTNQQQPSHLWPCVTTTILLPLTVCMRAEGGDKVLHRCAEGKVQQPDLWQTQVSTVSFLCSYLRPTKLSPANWDAPPMNPPPLKAISN